MMKIGFLQFCPIRNDVLKNTQQVSNLLKTANFDLVVLPELSNSGYLYHDRENLQKNSESKEGTGIFLTTLWKICREKRSCIITGFSELFGDHLFNSAVAISEEGIIAHYRKTHLYSTEKDLFTPGDTGFKVFEYRSVKIGMMICFDWIFPEASRKLATYGAQVIAHPANLVTPFCQSAMITRSIENKVFTITANRYGKENSESYSLTFTGHSQITSPAGRVIAQAKRHGSKTKIIEIDPALAVDKKFSDKNDLFEDRRPQLY